MAKWRSDETCRCHSIATPPYGVANKKIVFFVHNVMGRGGSVSDKRVKIWSDPLKSRDKHYRESVVGPQG